MPLGWVVAIKPQPIRLRLMTVRGIMLRSRSVHFALLLGIFSAVVLAQSATITGTITDPDGGLVKDASIQFKNSSSSAMLRGTSSSKGEYSISLPAGTYDLSVA